MRQKTEIEIEGMRNVEAREPHGMDPSCFELVFKYGQLRASLGGGPLLSRKSQVFLVLLSKFLSAPLPRWLRLLGPAPFQQRALLEYNW